MRALTAVMIIGGTLFCAALDLIGHSQTQPLPEITWRLPHELAVKDSGPRTYKFTVEYYSANSRGEIVRRQRLVAEYTRGLPGKKIVWKNVTLSAADGPTMPFGAARKLDFMQGFHYRDDLASTFSPDFFKGFPAGAAMARNLIWDRGMIEMFGQNYFGRLKLNEPYHAISNEDTDMPAVGRFHNRDVVLQWVGFSKRNGVDCALIEYQAFFNPLEIAVGGMTMKGRSDYWGQIWVSLVAKQIEYGTIHESVTGKMKFTDRDAPQMVNIFRTGNLEPISAN